jgi:hypothetical protein
MKTLIAFFIVLQVISTQANAALCSYTVFNPSNDEIAYHQDAEVEYDSAKAIAPLGLEYTLGEVSTSPDTYMEFIKVNTADAKKTELNCKQSFIYEMHIFIGVTASCPLQNGNHLEVMCKLY